MKNTNPKNMSIKEMWKLHLLLKSNKQDNVLEFLQGLTPKILMDSLRLMFGKVPDKNLSSHFLNGLEKTEYFSFEEFIKALK